MINKIFLKLEKFVPTKYHQVLNHTGFKRYFANTGWIFAGQIFSLFISFFIGTWIARYLGPENYGILSYSIAFVGLFGFISSLGVDGILNRELIKFPEKRDELLGTTFRLKLIGGLIAFLLTILSAFLFSTNPLITLLIILFSFSFVLQAINVISIYFQAETKSKNNVKILFFTTIISSLLKIIVLFLNKGIIWIAIIFVLDALWQWIGFVITYNKYGLKIKDWCFNKNLAQEILKNSWLLMFASAAGFIYLKIDQIMIGLMLGNYEVGLYSVAVKLTEIWYFIPTAICISLFPAIINAKKIKLETYKHRLKNLYILMIAISIVIIIPITLFAKQIIYTLFGNNYLESINILQIYIWSNLSMFLGTAVYQYFMTEDKIKIIFIITTLAMITNIGLNLIFIPIFNLAGAAYATLISYSVVPIGGYLYRLYQNWKFKSNTRYSD